MRVFYNLYGLSICFSIELHVMYMCQCMCVCVCLCVYNVVTYLLNKWMHEILPLIHVKA